MDILITGGAGFLGQHLCHYFVDRGDRVICYDNLITGRRENLQGLFEADNFKLVEQDVTEYIDLENLSGKFAGFAVDRVLHFASLASPRDYTEFPIKTLKVGGMGTHQTLGVAKRYGARFLLASTSEVYGDPEVNPQSEQYWGNVNPLGVRGVYDESKRFAEALTMAYHRAHGVETRIARIFNTYGPGMRVNDGRVVPNFVCQALSGRDLTVYGDGTQTRSFCFVSDLVRGLVSLLESSSTEPVNIGNPAEITINQFAEEVIQLTGSNSGIVYKPLPEDDPQVRRPDITRARRQLNWEPEVTLHEGLAQTVPYFKRLIEDSNC